MRASSEACGNWVFAQYAFKITKQADSKHPTFKICVNTYVIDLNTDPGLLFGVDSSRVESYSAQLCQPKAQHTCIYSTAATVVILKGEIGVGTIFMSISICIAICVYYTYTYIYIYIHNIYIYVLGSPCPAAAGRIPTGLSYICM